jgi:hypothetical protein
MPNETLKSVLLQAIELLIGALSTAERGRLRTWIAASYDARGYSQERFDVRDER